jgi:hypothetical protein
MISDRLRASLLKLLGFFESQRAMVAATVAGFG